MFNGVLVGKNINLRLVEVSDAKFIYDMRQDSKSKYLSVVNSGVESQIEWIKEYKKREFKGSEYYFVIESKNNESLGLVRLYDFRGDSFCWGSWIIKDNAPSCCAIESVLCVYDFAFYELGFKQSHFDVRKDNIKVIAFHKRFGAIIVSEDDENYYFKFTLEDYIKTRKKYAKFCSV
ncbi:GNAT family N-acetyltransferase [Campylobacter devanensis]|uniref:GNAT family N-acetyltransferase n=1 Tax=Campylobacter devanensis TaxID=3161138 RepID=UPI000A34CD0A|nr:GNAT family N-acetyltransferase [Campylobacter sp. P0132]